MWSYGFVKTTLEIPDPVFRRAKARAAERGQAFREFVTEALQDKLARPHGLAPADQAPWMRVFGGLRHLRRETARVQRAIDREFEVIEPEDRERFSTPTRYRRSRTASRR